jgi:dihydrodipicolinate reductase
VIAVAVSGAAGRMGETVCRAVEEADDLSLTGRADPSLGVALADVLDDADVVVDFSQPDATYENARAGLEASGLAVRTSHRSLASARRTCSSRQTSRSAPSS